MQFVRYISAVCYYHSRMLGKHFQHSAWVESKQVTFSPVYHVAGMQLSNKYYAKHEAQAAWLAPSSKQTVNTEVHVYVVANRLLDKKYMCKWPCEKMEYFYIHIWHALQTTPSFCSTEWCTLSGLLVKSTPTYWWEAEYNVEVISCSGDKVVIEVLLGGWSPRILLLHHRDQFSSYLIQFIPSKKVGDLPWGEHIVEVLQEALILHLIVCEDECDALSLQTWHRRNK